MPDILIRNIDKETLEKLKSKAAEKNRQLQAELHEMSQDELEHYEDTIYWARAAALSMIQYLKKFGHLKLLQAPEPVTIVEDFTEEEE